VMVCDTRLVTKGYGRSFIQALPPMRRTRSLDEVQRFLRERLA
jgi:ATP-dependent DNA helicase DinG